jgi:hypothetical protein
MGSFRSDTRRHEKIHCSRHFCRLAGKPAQRALRKSTGHQAENPDNGGQFVFALW